MTANPNMIEKRLEVIATVHERCKKIKNTCELKNERKPKYIVSGGSPADTVYIFTNFSTWGDPGRHAYILNLSV